jgi:hypothetical protein
MAAAAKPSARADNPKRAPAEGRTDPRPRAIGGRARFEIANADHARFKYAGVFRGDEDAMQNYGWLGWTPVEYTGKGGPHIAGMVTGEPGQHLEWKGHIVMSIPRDEHAAIVAEGQERGDMLSRQMQGGQAARREVGSSPYAPVENETSDLYEEQR